VVAGFYRSANAVHVYTAVPEKTCDCLRSDVISTFADCIAIHNPCHFLLFQVHTRAARMRLGAGSTYTANKALQDNNIFQLPHVDLTAECGRALSRVHESHVIRLMRFEVFHAEKRRALNGQLRLSRPLDLLRWSFDDVTSIYLLLMWDKQSVPSAADARRANESKLLLMSVHT
jgi:uncharacterized membrane protein YsdA (DUF1294 family)